MSNQIVSLDQFRAALPAAARAKAAQGQLNRDLSEGITAGFGIVSLRGKNWRVKYQGNERVVLAPDGRSPAYTLEVVIVKASAHISKIWYEHGYVEGSNAPPDCWSVNGVAPDPASPKRQNQTCAGCKWNAWGSTRTQGGSGKGKDCADSKRIAIVPANDMKNERDGGPMLLRIPPASLAEVLQYAQGLASMGITYDAVVTELSFDMEAEYPRVLFRPLRPLTDAEYALVEEMQKTDQVRRILDTAVDHVQTDGVDTSHTGSATQTPAQPVQQPQAAPAALQSAPAPVQPEPVPHDATTGEVLEPDEEDAKKRAAMRALGLGEEQIIAALGPVKMRPVAPPEDPRIGQMKAMGLTDEQIKAALSLIPSTPQGNSQPATPQPQVEEKKRTRRSKAEMEAAKAATKPQEPSQAAPAPQATPQPQTAAKPTPSLPGWPTKPNGQAGAAHTETAPAAAPEPSMGDTDLDAMLEAMLPKG